MKRYVKRAGGLCLAVFTLSGCLSDAGGPGGEGFVSRFKIADKSSFVRETHQDEVSGESQIIQALAARRSTLPPTSSFSQVATSVLAAKSRAAETELRAARLRSEAASTYWLPRIGRQINLSSLGTIVADLAVDRALSDPDRPKGERAFAIADVDVAAVGLARDTNERVHTALTLYTNAVEAREKAALAQRALQDMGHFAWIMEARVKGGVSDLSDLDALTQKLNAIEADQRANAERAETSIAELNALSEKPLDDLRGVPRFEVTTTSAQPLDVVLAEAEKTRTIAAAQVERAGNPPDLSAAENSQALQVKSESPPDPDPDAALKAIEAAKDAARRRVVQASEESSRKLRKLEEQIADNARQADAAANLTIQAKSNLDLAQEQYDADQQQVLDVVSVYETYARRQEAEVALKYETVRLKLDLAQLLGILVDGDAI